MTHPPRSLSGVSAVSSGISGIIFAHHFPFLLTLFLATVPAPAAERGEAGSASKGPRIVGREEIEARFRQGAPAAEVIVTLVAGSRNTANTDWNNRDSVAELHRTNRALTDAVLGRLEPGDFKLEVRYDNFPGFAGAITERGFARLSTDPAVASIEPNRIVHAQPKSAPPEVAPEVSVVPPGTGALQEAQRRIAALEARVAALEKELAELRRMVRRGASRGSGQGSDRREGVGRTATGGPANALNTDGTSAQDAREGVVRPESDRNR